MNTKDRLSFLSSIIGIVSLVIAVISVFPFLRNLLENGEFGDRVTLGLSAILIITVLLSLIKLVFEKPQREPRRVSTGSPKVSSTEILQAAVNLRNGLIDRDELPNIVLEAVNIGAISPKGGAKVLEEFGYSIVLSPENTFKIIDGGISKAETKFVSGESETQNRLTALLMELAQTFELPIRVNYDQEGVELGIPIDNHIYTVSFDISNETAYQFATAISGPDDDINKLVTKLTSQQYTGLTTRISKGKLIVLGGRESLDRISNDEILRLFMDDIARLTGIFELSSQHLLH
ncbi:MAG: hypothetical protein DWQ07_13870 [Chloroflexi bacterium]|nr:MAG: hypothetical protein DWQ07_13870 [Chloroflexota bacterium]MBL1197423.1 hypothetical protein [Chloroflexota bacterium]NOH14718.1 hypothetical protein [Chloroflexota bacterium]